MELSEFRDSCEKVGMLKERNRILALLVKYKDAGWLDEALSLLLAEDICIDE